MTVKDFINTFSHNNELYIENSNNYWMKYRYHDGGELIDKGTIMDWQLLYTDISDKEVICIKNVYHKDGEQGITLKINTDKEEFQFIKELVNYDNCPLWLYNKVNNYEL